MHGTPVMATTAAGLNWLVLVGSVEFQCPDVKEMLVLEL